MALLSAGGTGGHLFPAEALAVALKARGHGVTLITDTRARPFLDTFPADRVEMVAASTLAGRSPVAMAKMLATNGIGFVRSLKIIREAKPDVAVGFGGYPTLAPLNAANFLKVPAVVHEANAVPGRANRSLARFAHVATSFPTVPGFAKPRSVTFVGMPVRPAVTAAARPYEAPGETFRLLVFGGSQGARVFADLVPPALAALPEAERARLRVTQQCRPEDMDRVRAAYAAAGIEAELASFFRDLPERMAAAHAVVARSGASTVAELSVIGRPGLLVPLPGAIDQDQAHNAAAFAAAGAGIHLPQAELTPAKLSGEIERIMNDPAWLAKAAAAASGFARPDAAGELASLIERIAEFGAP